MVQTLPSTHRTISLHYDGTGYYAYVLLRSSDKQLPITPEEADIVKNVLRENGISSIRTGQSFRPASDNQQYDLYIRVIDNGTKPDHEKITEIFKKLSKEGIEEETPQDVQELLKQHIQDLEVERQEKRQVLLELQNIKNIIKALESEKSTLMDKNLEISQSLQRFELIIQSKTEEYSFYEKELLVDNKTLKSTNEQLSLENQHLITMSNNAETQKTYHENEYKKISREYKKLQSVLSTNKAATRDTDSDFSKLLDCLLPEVLFKKGSMDLLKTEIRYELALQKIKKIIMGDITPDDTIKRKGHPTWLEHHFASGQGHNNGRIYSAKGKDSKYRILIGLKETQDEDIEGLQDISLQ